ncbi:MAG: FeoA family protein [Pirellulales bacterium]|jgi:ferrous iron transport protein A
MSLIFHKGPFAPSDRVSHRRPNALIPLDRLPTGQSATVGQVVGHPDQVHRLEELGIRCGALVEMFRAGSPCIIRLAGQKLCFRANGLVNVLVTPWAFA